MMSKNTKIVLALLAAVLVLAVVPFFLAPGAEFGGSDDAGSRMVEQIQGEAYEPWFTPVLETLLGGELPGEIEPAVLRPDRHRCGRAGLRLRLFCRA
jgi:cobalt/nickel transport protein